MIDEKAQKEEQIKANLARIKHRLIVMSGKGGVGKSFVAANLAYGLALQGKTVGILDVDIHGPSMVKITNIEGKPIPVHPESGLATPIKVFSNLYVLSVASLLGTDHNALIWRGPLKMALIKQFFSDFYWEELDYLVVDCPPGTGDEPLSVVQILGKVDGVIIVTTPQDVAIIDVKKAIDFTQKMNAPIIGVIENMKYFRCPKCQEKTVIFNGNQIKEMILENSLNLLAELEIDPDIAQSMDNGKPYIYFYNQNFSAKALTGAVEKIVDLVENRSTSVKSG